MKTIRAWGIDFSVEDTCPACGEADQSCNFTIYDILECGYPICRECGRELDINQDVEVNVEVKNENNNTSERSILGRIFPPLRG